MSKKTEIITREEQMPERRSETASLTPMVDIFENDHEILLHADMPGVSKDAVSVNIDNGRLEISGLRKLVHTSGSVTWQEFGDVEYRRVFSVPQTIDVAKVAAELKDGVLKLHLPKSEKAKPRMIEIKAG